MSPPVFDPLTTTAAELEGYLSAGKLTSADVVEIYLAKIEKYNGWLKAVIATTPRERLLQKAKELDEERSKGSVRSKLHGVPILVKDNIATHPDLGMDTTAGSFALAGSRPRKSADIVERLINAGVIILGKANLSELSYWKDSGLICGWSAVGGQGQSAYVRGGITDDDDIGGHSNPGGSSAGSAIAVSAGFSPISIGTETNGSLLVPSGRAALYTIKPTIGIVSQQGIVPISSLCDSAGPMTKSVLDLANLMDVIVDPSKTTIPTGGYVSVMTDSWADLKVGVLDPNEWNLPARFAKPNEVVTKQMNEAFQDAYAKIKSKAKSFHANVPLPNGSALELNGEDCLESIWTGHFRADFEAYTSGIDASPVSTLDELVAFNKQHADKELPPKYPNQARLEAALASTHTAASLSALLAHVRDVARTRGVDKVLRDFDLDVIVGPAESAMSGIASAAGYPIASLPLGYLDCNGRPFALAVLARAHEEALLIKVQSAWEKMVGGRRAPPVENLGGP